MEGAPTTPPNLAKVPRRLAKECYLIAYAKYAQGLQPGTDDKCQAATDTKSQGNDLTHCSKDCSKGSCGIRSVLPSGWRADRSVMPVFLTEDEASVTPSWQDYNRINVSATFLPAGSGTTRSFILVQSKVFRTAYFSYAPAADDQTYDLTKPPVLRRLTRAQEERYWSDLPYYRRYFAKLDEKRLSVVLGISPDGFQLGNTTAQTTDAAKATYLLGGSFAFNPYASFYLGEATSDGRHFRPAFGFGLDIDIISKIFGGTKLGGASPTGFHAERATGGRDAYWRQATMSDHDGFLEGLLARFPSQLFLVNRFRSDELGFAGDATLRVFIPDFHWMSAASAPKFTGYHFNGNTSAPGGTMLAQAFLTALEQYRAVTDEMAIFQLGDRFDLWREATTGAKDPLDLYRKIRTDPGVKPLADRLDALGAEYVRGNHDHWLNQVDPTLPEPQRSRDEIITAQGIVYLTHGHRYDQTEQMLPDDFKAWAVQQYPKAPSEVHDIGRFEPETLNRIRSIQAMRAANPGLSIYPDPRPDGARLVTSPQDVDAVGAVGSAFLEVTGFCHDPGDANDFENHINFLRFAGKIYDFERTNHTSRHVYVIGHTHHARMFVDKHPRNAGPLVTMDCGGWVEQCTVVSPGATVAHAALSAQFGVQCGNDLRIYQLGGNDAA